MRIIRSLGLEGPNIWMKRRALEVWLEQQPVEPQFLSRCSNEIAKTCDAGARALYPSDSPPLDGPATPLDAADVLVTLILNLQRRVDLPVSEGFVVRGDEHFDCGQRDGLEAVLKPPKRGGQAPFCSEDSSKWRQSPAVSGPVPACPADSSFKPLPR